jgi:hypothetical protein
MHSSDLIQHHWHESAAGWYVSMRPLKQPTEQDWVAATERMLSDYRHDSIYMIIDNNGFMSVMTKAGFDAMIGNLLKQGLKRSTVGVVISDQHYEIVARMFEVPTSGLGFVLEMQVFRELSAAGSWLGAQMRDG